MIPSPPTRFEPLRLLVAGHPVFQALDRQTGRLVHLKLGRSRDSVLRETLLLKRVAGPFTPAFLCLIRDGDRRWLATEWVEGRPLGEQPPPAPSWPTDLLRALSHIHRHDVVHGDLKPGNVLCRPDGTFCLVDFEFARRAGDELSPRDGGGTRGFVAPERFTGWPADPRSDLYSLGRTIEALTRPSAEAARILARLATRTPSGRPARAGSLLPEFSRSYGIGQIPAPDLALAGWSRDFPGLDRLARGLQVWLGLDALAARRIAEELLVHSGGVRSIAQDVVRQWLTDRAMDPWSDRTPEDGIESREGLRAAVEATATASFGRLSHRARTTLGRLAHRTAPLSDGLIPTSADPTTADGEDRGDVAARAAGSGLDELIGAHLLLSDQADSGAVRFVSPTHRRLALDLLPAARAAALHRRSITRLRRALSDGGDPLVLRPRLAWHLTRAGEAPLRSEAIEHLGITSDLATAAGRTSVAFEALDEAVRLMNSGAPGPGSIGPGGAVGSGPPRPAPADSADWRPRFIRYAERLSVIGRVSEARRILEGLHGAARDGNEVAEVALLLAELDVREQNREAALATADRLLTRGALPQSPLAARARLVRARALIGLGRLTESVAALDGPGGGDGPVVEPDAAVLITRGLIAHRLGDPVAARREWIAALRLARRHGWNTAECGALVNLGVHHASRQRPERAMRYLRRAADLAHRLGYRKIEWEAVSNLTELALRRERWRDALDFGERGRQLALEAGVRLWGARALTRLARIHLRRGRLRTAESLQSEAYLMLDREAAPYERLSSLLQRFEVDLWYRQRRPEDAAWQEAIRLEAELGSRRASDELRTLSALRALHDGAAPAELLPDLLHIPGDPDLIGWRRLARARVRHAAGDEAEARVDLLAALEEWRRPGSSRHDEAFALLELGRLEGGIDPGAGRGRLEEAIRLARRIGARWIEAEASIERLALESIRPDPAAAARAGGTAPPPG